MPDKIICSIFLIVSSYLRHNDQLSVILAQTFWTLIKSSFEKLCDDDRNRSFYSINMAMTSYLLMLGVLGNVKVRDI